MEKEDIEQINQQMPLVNRFILAYGQLKKDEEAADANANTVLQIVIPASPSIHEESGQQTPQTCSAANSPKGIFNLTVVFLSALTDMYR